MVPDDECNHAQEKQQHDQEHSHSHQQIQAVFQAVVRVWLDGHRVPRRESDNIVTPYWLFRCKKNIIAGPRGTLFTRSLRMSGIPRTSTHQRISLPSTVMTSLPSTVILSAAKDPRLIPFRATRISKPGCPILLAASSREGWDKPRLNSSKSPSATKQSHSTPAELRPDR